MSAEPILSVQNLGFSYGDNEVFASLDLALREGELTLLESPSGGGKSTLLRLLARMEKPGNGTIHYGGKDASEISVHTYRRKIAYLQQLPLMVEGSVKENLLLSFRFANGEIPPGDERLTGMLSRAQLGSVTLDHPAAELSVGQKQRVALLRLVLLDPDVYLLDEPIASLDDESTALVMNEIERLSSEDGKTVILAAHGISESRPRFTRKLAIRDKKIGEQG
ncbi:MAG: ABC transporter [Ectothiorhodospiraceae bacterium]|nr:ABC transporter [Ectothiorhodospiraceae bacterium]